MANASGFMGFQKSSPATKKKSAPVKKVKGAAPKPAKAKAKKGASRDFRGIDRKTGQKDSGPGRIASAMTGRNYSAANC